MGNTSCDELKQIDQLIRHNPEVMAEVNQELVDIKHTAGGFLPQKAVVDEIK